MAKRSQPAAVDGRAPAERDGDLSPPEHLDRIIAELAACEAKGDNELTRHAGRKLLAVMACAADALLLDGGKTLQAAPDKVGAFFEKSAAGFVQALDGLHKRAALTEAVHEANDMVGARPRVDDPLAAAIAAWGSSAIPPTRSGAG
jgi:hypothetical protein